MATVQYKKTGLMTTSQYAKAVGLSPATVLRACIAKEIKALKTPGGHYRIPAVNVATNPWWNHKPTRRELKAGMKQLKEHFKSRRTTRK